MVGFGLSLLLAWRFWGETKAPRARDERATDKNTKESKAGGSAAAAAPKLVKGFFESKSAPKSRERKAQPPITPDNGQVVDPDEALAAFSAALDELDELAESGRTPSQAEKAALYRQTNDAFKVLSTFTDARNLSDRDLLEQAYRDMKQRLAALEIGPPDELADRAGRRRRH